MVPFHAGRFIFIGMWNQFETFCTLNKYVVVKLYQMYFSIFVLHRKAARDFSREHVPALIP